MKRLLLVGLLLLPGCSGSGNTVAKPVSKADIAALEVAVTGAVNLANTCLRQRLGPCGKDATRAVIISDEHKAIGAFRNVQSASADKQPALLAVANELLAQLANDTPKQ